MGTLLDCWQHLGLWHVLSQPQCQQLHFLGLHGYNLGPRTWEAHQHLLLQSWLSQCPWKVHCWWTSDQYVHWRPLPSSYMLFWFQNLQAGKNEKKIDNQFLERIIEDKDLIGSPSEANISSKREKTMLIKYPYGQKFRAIICWNMMHGVHDAKNMANKKVQLYIKSISFPTSTKKADNIHLMTSLWSAISLIIKGHIIS